MPTLRETWDQTAVEQKRGELRIYKDLSVELANSMRELEAKESIARELLELTKDRPEAKADHRRATEKLAKFAKQHSALERRIGDNEHRIRIIKERIAQFTPAGDPSRAGRVQQLFQQLGVHQP